MRMRCPISLCDLVFSCRPHYKEQYRNLTAAHSAREACLLPAAAQSTGDSCGSEPSRGAATRAPQAAAKRRAWGHSHHHLRVLAPLPTRPHARTRATRRLRSSPRAAAARVVAALAETATHSRLGVAVGFRRDERRSPQRGREKLRVSAAKEQPTRSAARDCVRIESTSAQQTHTHLGYSQYVLVGTQSGRENRRGALQEPLNATMVTLGLAV